jgi:hypothetical protein
MVTGERNYRVTNIGILTGSYRRQTRVLTSKVSSGMDVNWSVTGLCRTVTEILSVESIKWRN